MMFYDLTRRSTNACSEIFDDYITLDFNMQNNNQVVINFSDDKAKTSRKIIVSTKDTKRFIDLGTKKLNSPDKSFNDFIFNFLIEAKATYLIDWHSFIRTDKSFKLSIEEIESFSEKLNLYLPIIFGEDSMLKFSALKSRQLKLSSRLTTTIDGAPFVQASFKVNESDTFFNKANEVDGTELIIEIIRFLKSSNATKIYNWDSVIKYDLEGTFDKEVINKARKMLKEHYQDLNEFYFEDYIKWMDSLKEDKEAFLDFWKEQISTKLPVIKDLSKFSSYSRIKKEKDFPKIIFSTPTASVSFTNKTHIDMLSVKINNKELNLIKNTEAELKHAIEVFVPYKELKNHIDKHIQKLLLEFTSSKYSEYKNIYDCERELLARSNYYFDVNDWCMILKNGYLFFNNMEFSFDFIDRHFEELNKSIKSEFNKRVSKLSNSFSRDDNYYALKAVSDNSRKGITTYISILKGESNSKIREYGYDKSTAYGKLSQYTKKEIESVIRNLIRDRLILEKNFRASFGNYTGLELSKESIDYIRKAEVEKEEKEVIVELKINSVSDFIKRFIDSDNNNRNLILIKSLKDNIESISQTDIQKMIDFIKDNRKLYRECEKEIIDLFSYITPSKYKALYLLNANLSNGVLKDTFTSIYNNTSDDSSVKEVTIDKNREPNNVNESEYSHSFKEINEKDIFNNFYLCEACLFHDHCDGVFCLRG